MEASTDLHDVRDCLGHANITTTSRYLRSTPVRGLPVAGEALGVVNREWVLFSLVLCDPHGFRPLVIGDALAVWSETCALDLIDTSYVLKSEPMVRMWGPYPIF